MAFPNNVLEIVIVTVHCRNMSGHALMGRPAARLETMALAFSAYAVVFTIDKRQ